jgi:putative phosphoesterase
MHVLVTSDLHFGANRRGDEAVRALAAGIAEDDAAALVVVGDIATDEATLHACLELFAPFGGMKLALPGNHDVWLPGHRARDSWHLHEDVLPEIFAQHGFRPLHLGPVVLGDLAFVGSMGWYDYSFRDDIGIELERYRAKTLPRMTRPIWNDARFARFPMSDEELTAELATRLEAQLAEIAHVPRAMAFVHHVVTKELLVHPRALVPRVYRFANAFLGSERFREVLERHAPLGRTFSGHIHREKTITHGERSYTTIGSDYRRKQLWRVSCVGAMEKSVFVADAQPGSARENSLT